MSQEPASLGFVWRALPQSFRGRLLCWVATLTLATLVLHFTPTRSVTAVHWRYEWTFWLGALTLAGALGTLISTRCSLSAGDWCCFLLGNLFLATLVLVALSGEVLAWTLWIADLGLRVGFALGWLAILVGANGWIAWMWQRRQTSPRLPAPTWLARWFSLLLLILTLEVGTWPLQLPERQLYRAPVSLPTDWPLENDDTLRVAVIGGSTSMGFPYQPQFSLLTTFVARLQQQFPGLTIEAENLALGGIDLREAVSRIKTLPWRPHILLVYSGHNEFFYELEGVLYAPASSAPMLDRLLFWSRSYQLFTGIIPRWRGPERLSLIRDQQVLRDPLFSPARRAEHLERFRRQLRQLAEDCLTQQIQTIWVLPAASENLFEPTRSQLSRKATAHEEREIRELLDTFEQAARKQQWAAAEQGARQIIARFPEAAIGYFRLGEALAALGKVEAARTAFREAIDRDGHPAQASSAIRDAVRHTAEEFDIPWIDAEPVLRSLSPSGLLDRSVIHDHVHPTWRGHAALGLALADDARVNQWVQRLSSKSRGVILPSEPSEKPEPSGSRQFPLDLTALLVQQQFAAEHLALAYERTAWCLRHLARLQTDRRRREAEAAIYDDWARRLRAGEILPGEAGTESLSGDGIPGVILPAIDIP